MADWTDFIGPALQVGGGLASELMTSDDREALKRRIEQALAQYDGLEAPALQSIHAEQLGPSALERISTDPRFRQEQLRSLDALGEIEKSGGLTLDDRAALNEQLGRSARQEQAQRQSLARDFANRGQLGSGAQLAMAMQNQQASAQRGSEEALRTSADAQRRYFQAIAQRGQQAGQMESADYGRQSDLARARDVIQAHNLASRERTNMYNAGLSRQNFQNRLNLAGAKSNAQLGGANYQQQQIDRKAGQIAGMGDAAGKMANAYSQQARDDKRWDDYIKAMNARKG